MRYDRNKSWNVDTTEPLPTKIPIGALFMWRGKIWRKGRGILYRAHPCVRGLVYECFQRRARKRSA
jgi:hypothetical protein